MPGREPPQVLILGGTGEARALAALLHSAYGERIAVTSSLAGATRRPAMPPGRLRIGGFGGVSGLAAYLAANRVAALIDATHPFAATMSRHACDAAERVGVPRLALVRPPWREAPGDRWIAAENADDAARLARSLGRRIFVAFAGRELAPFVALADASLLVRRAEPATEPGPPNVEYIVERGPFAAAADRALLRGQGVEVVAAKASGGAAAYAKLEAARSLGLPVVLIPRPPPPPGPQAGSVEAAASWLEAKLGLDAAAGMARNRL